MKKEKVIDGIVYVLGTYNYGKEIEINDRIMEVNIDPRTKTPVPMLRGGLQKLLVLVASLKSWGFKGVNEEGDVITDASAKVLPMTEENIKCLPKKHGDILLEIANELNGISEGEEKNLSK